MSKQTEKMDAEKREWTEHVVFFSTRIYNQLKHIKDREDWESEVTDYLEMISDEIAEELELMSFGDF